MTSYYDGLNEKLFAQLPEAANALEFGCAQGRLGEKYKAKFPGARWTGLDINPDALKVAATRLDRAWRIDLDADMPDFGQEKFDLVVFGDLLEHIKNPRQFLLRMNALCENHARLICCVPNMSHYSVLERMLIGDITYDSMGLLDDTHLRFFSPGSLIKLFLDTGWLPHLADSYTVNNNPPVLEHLVRAAQQLGSPPATALRNLTLYQLIFHCKRGESTYSEAAAGSSFSVVVPVTNPLQLELNIKRSPGIAETGAEVILVSAAASAAAAFKAGAERVKHDWILFCHQDVYIPENSGHKISRLIAACEDAANKDPLIGFAGLSLVDNRAVHYSGLVVDRLSLFDFPESAMAVSIDEFAVAMRKNSKHAIDEKLGWHLWATDLCLQASARTGHGARIARIPLYHNSLNDGALNEAFHASARVLKAKYPNLNAIPTLAAGTI